MRLWLVVLIKNGADVCKSGVPIKVVFSTIFVCVRSALVPWTDITLKKKIKPSSSQFSHCSKRGLIILHVYFVFLQEKVILGSDYPFPLGEHHPGKLIEDVYKDDLELRVWSRNFATMVTWRHTSPLYKHWYRLITVEPRLRSLKRGLVISRFFSIHYTVTGAENIVRYTEDFVISRFHCKPQVETTGSLVRKRKRNRPHPSPQVLTIASIRSFPSLWISLNPHPLSSGETKWFSINSVYDSSILSLCLRGLNWTWKLWKLRLLWSLCTYQRTCMFYLLFIIC